MRFKDLKKDTVYATCDGQYVKVLDTEHNDLVRVKLYDKNGKAVVGDDGNHAADFVPVDSLDPWGDCHTGVKMHRDRDYPKGVKVALYEVIDHDGIPVEGVEPKIVTVRQADIKGLWDDYMILHGEVVRAAADKRALVDESNAKIKEMYERMHAVTAKITTPDVVSVSIGISERRGWKNELSGVFRFDLSFHARDDERTTTDGRKEYGVYGDEMEAIIAAFEKLVGIKQSRKTTAFTKKRVAS